MKKNLLACALFFAAVTGIEAQCLMSPVLLSARIPQSDLVVEGRVVNQTSFWNAEHNRIYTSSLIDVYKTFKNAGASYIEVITEGGTVGDRKQVVHPELELSMGDVGVFTLIPNAQPAQFGKPVFEAYASAQGFIRYNVAEDKATEPFNTYNQLSTSLYPAIQQLTGAGYVQVKSVNPFQQAVATGNTTQGIAAITNFSPTTITAGTYSVLTINGTGFGGTANATLVGFKNANDGGASNVSPSATEIISWSATQIQVRVPSDAGTGRITVNGSTSTGNLTIPYSHLNVNSGTTDYMTKHINKNAGGYVWTYNSSFMANTAAKAAFERSMNSWRCATLVNWTLASGTSAIATGVRDNVNIVTFQTTGLPAGVLGRCANYFAGCSVGGSEEWYVDELDIVFAPNPGGGTWQYGPSNPSGSQYDFESVTVHELGHGHELGHVINTSDLMHYALAAGQVKRALNSDDLNGGLAVMNRNAQSGGTCGNPLMVPLAASSCSLGSLNAAMNTASGCVNQAISLTDASSGPPTSWSWSMPGGTPSTANTQNTSVTYATSGSKVVSLTVTSGTASSTTSQTITVYALPSLSVAPTATTICPGQSIILKASGATSYTWTPGPGSLPNFPVSPSTTTTYNVSGTANSCVSAPTSVVVTVVPCTGLEDLVSHKNVSVYPNPGTGVFTVSSNDNTGKLDVTVMNALGQVVKTESSKDPKTLVIDLSTQSKGVYYMKVQMDEGAKLMKVILN